MATNKMSTVEEEEIDLLALAKYLFHYVVWIVAIGAAVGVMAAVGTKLLIQWICRGCHKGDAGLCPRLVKIFCCLFAFFGKICEYCVPVM